MKIQDREQLLNTKAKNKQEKQIQHGNIALDQIIKDIKPKHITALNELTYSTAKAITERCATKKKNRNRTSHKKPVWRHKIQKEIDAFRGELSILKDLSKGIKMKMIQQQQKNKTESQG